MQHNYYNNMPQMGGGYGPTAVAPPVQAGGDSFNNGARFGRRASPVSGPAYGDEGFYPTAAQSGSSMTMQSFSGGSFSAIPGPPPDFQGRAYTGAAPGTSASSRIPLPLNIESAESWSQKLEALKQLSSQRGILPTARVGSAAPSSYSSGNNGYVPSLLERSASQNGLSSPGPTASNYNSHAPYRPAAAAPAPLQSPGPYNNSLSSPGPYANQPGPYGNQPGQYNSGSSQYGSAAAQYNNQPGPYNNNMPAQFNNQPPVFNNQAHQPQTYGGYQPQPSPGPSYGAGFPQPNSGFQQSSNGYQPSNPGPGYPPRVGGALPGRLNAPASPGPNMATPAAGPANVQQMVRPVAAPAPQQQQQPTAPVTPPPAIRTAPPAAAAPPVTMPGSLARLGATGAGMPRPAAAPPTAAAPAVAPATPQGQSWNAPKPVAAPAPATPLARQAPPSTPPAQKAAVAAAKPPPTAAPPADGAMLAAAAPPQRSSALAALANRRAQAATQAIAAAANQAPPPEKMPPAAPVKPVAAAAGKYNAGLKGEFLIKGSVPAGAESGPDGPMHQCPTCGRTFNETAFAKHTKVCQKVFVNKRKAYNAAEKRIGGTEATKYFDVKKGVPKSEATCTAPSKPGMSGKPAAAGKKAKWKAQSDQLRAAMAANKAIAEAKARGEDITKLKFDPGPELDDDRVQCPHCGRKFAADTAERHIPKCAETKARPNKVGAGIKAAAYNRR